MNDSYGKVSSVFILRLQLTGTFFFFLTEPDLTDISKATPISHINWSTKSVSVQLNKSHRKSCTVSSHSALKIQSFFHPSLSITSVIYLITLQSLPKAFILRAFILHLALKTKKQNNSIQQLQV